MGGRQDEDAWIGKHRREPTQFKQPRFDLHKKKRSLEPDRDTNMDKDTVEDKDLVLSSNSDSISSSNDVPKTSVRKTSMFPFTVDPYDFAPGDWVREIISGQSATPFIGVVVSVQPKAGKVMVKWPHGVTQKDPEWLMLVNKETSQVITRSATKIANLARIASTLKGYGYSDVETFLRLKKAYGESEPMEWLAGTVEIVYPKKTASYSENGETVRALLHMAYDLNAVFKGLPDEMRGNLWPS